MRSSILPSVFDQCNEIFSSEAPGRVEFCVNPEFLREGTAIEDFEHPPFTLLGVEDKQIEATLRSIYKSIDAPVRVLSPKESLFVKYASNAYHALKIAFANELGALCEQSGIDGQKVMSVFCMDTKLNISTRYLMPGFAFGGSCLPKDVRALSYAAKTYDLDIPLINSLLPSNEKVVERAFRKVCGSNFKRIGFWHTNVHEYAATRSRWFLDHLPKRQATGGASNIQELVLGVVARFYRRASVLFAPNPELCRLLEERTGRPCHLMQRGIDAQLFSPERRDRGARDADFVLGFVGRLSVEKNVALLAKVQMVLEGRGIRNFRFRIVGQGSEEAWLREHLPRAEFTGVLRGEALARAYAGMDVFLFPSHTDTFGNVVLEAMASGVPAVVTPDGGPRSLVRDGRTGFIVDDADFSAATARILGDSALREGMRASAREYALAASWDAVFEGVYAAYEPALRPDSADSRRFEAGAAV